MWDAVTEVLGIVEEDVRVPCRAGGLVHQMETFSFVFILKMMLKILRMMNDLSLLLQKKDQNVVQVCDGSCYMYLVCSIYFVHVNIV